MRLIRESLAAAGLTLAAASPALAQQDVVSSQPWAPFFGCWAPAEGPRTLAVSCVLPVAGSPRAAEQVSVVAGNVVRRLPLHADGERRAIDAEGCDGWESATFSGDGARVYTRGAATCAEGTEQTTSSLLSITPQGEFLQVRAVLVGEQRTVTTQRLARLQWVELPPAVESRLAPLAMMAEGARALAARPVSLEVIEDALQSADASVVEAWMAETGTADSRFRVTRRELQRLVAMNAPTRIIDLSVALANPDRFAPRVERADDDGNQRWRNSGGAGGGSFNAVCDRSQLWQGSDPFWAPMLYPGVGMAYYAWNYGGYPDCFGRGLYSRWAFGPFGYGGWNGAWYGGPFTGTTGGVVVSTRPRTPGTVTKGSGYTRGRNSAPTSGNGQPRWISGPATVQSSGSASSSSSGSSSSSSGGTRSAGSNGTGRTAQPRNP